VHRPRLARIGVSELLRVAVVVLVLAACPVTASVRYGRAVAPGRITGRLGGRLGGRVGDRITGRLGGRVGGRPARSWPETLADDVVSAFARLGPMFVKLGQLMASSPGMFPDVLSNAALRCLDDMPPFPAPIARRRVAEDLGAPLDRLFRAFDDRPLAAGSIAQVHACVLADGREAVVKVRRPGIRRRMMTDLRIMYQLSRVLDRYTEVARLSSMVGIIEQLFETTCKELNFALEAHNQGRFGAGLDAYGDNAQVAVPEVYWSHCGPRTICMQRFHGTPLDELAGAGTDAELAVRRGVKVWLEAALAHGPFHGDVHAGNLWLLDDGRLAYLDFGIMGELAPRWRDLLRDMLYTVMFDRDFERVARGLRRCEVLGPDGGTDAQLGRALRALFNPLLDSPVSRLNSRAITEMLLSTARQHAGSAPPELALFTKQLLYFERYSAALAPGWVLGEDPFVLRNVFPAEATERAAALGVPMPD
jgi:predicted unusual protein kinase regulating ubiquinone biosynthesis (AarF/ABC1/UbiB family)